MTEAIAVRNLGKRFSRYHVDRPTSLKEALVRGLRWVRPIERFWALREVNLSIPAGRMVGIIGPNGAGKSTLLRLIGGIERPDEGQVMVQGRIDALLDLGAGFHPDLTGRENVFINGVIAGLTRQQVAERFASIVDFAELREFIDSPLRTYSTGMQVRLGFAVAAHLEPEILLIDEVLAVGDMAFQRKCLQRIAQFKADGCTIILVSHDLSAVRQLCDEALWLRQGRVAAYGPAALVADQYVAEVSAETRRRTPAAAPVEHTRSGRELRINENRLGSLEMQISGVRLADQQGEPVSELNSGEPLSVQLDYLAPEPISDPIFVVTIRREDGLVCYDTSTEVAGLRLPAAHRSGRIAFHIERLDLIGGQYYVDVGVFERQWAYAYDYHWNVYPLVVRPTGGEKGILRPPHFWRVEALPVGAVPAQKAAEES